MGEYSGTCGVRKWEGPLGKHLRTQAKKQGPVGGAIHSHHWKKEPFYPTIPPLIRLPWIPSKTTIFQENPVPTCLASSAYKTATLLHPASHGPQALPWILIRHPEVHIAPPQCFPPSPFCSCPVSYSQEEQGSERSFSHKYTPIPSDSFRPDQRFLPGAERVPGLWGRWPGWPPLPTKSQGH